MQCHTLGIKSFIECGVRNSLLPLLVSYLTDRKMTVKYREAISSERSLPGGGAQGTLLGPIEYSCQSNDSANCVNENQRYKFVDDLTTIEVISVITKVVAYNFHHHVASDIGINSQYIPKENLETQNVISSINSWTLNQKMKLNSAKTKYMIINYTRKYQFNTRLTLNDTILDCIQEIKLLGVELNDDLTWKDNTSTLVKKGFARLSLLRKLVCFSVPKSDLTEVFIIFIRSLLEYCCVVWHSTITEEEKTDLERVQKCAVRIILRNDYTTYEEGLEKLNLVPLLDRREELLQTFAQQCLKTDKTAKWFPKNIINDHNTRNTEEYKVQFANNERLRNSTIPYLQRLLNKQNSSQ